MVLFVFSHKRKIQVQINMYQREGTVYIMCDNILIMYRLNIWSPLEVILPFYKLVVPFGWWWNLTIKQHVKFVNQAVKKHVSKDFQRCHRTMPSCCNPPPWDPGTCRHCQKSNAVLRRRATVTEGGWIHPSLKIPGSYRKGQVLKSSSFPMVDQQLVAVVFKEVSKNEGLML